MAPDTVQAETIESSGFPLGFRVAAGTARPNVLGMGKGRDVYVVEARVGWGRFLTLYQISCAPRAAMGQRVARYKVKN